MIVEKSLNDLKPQIYKKVLEKTEEYIKDHKNLQFKLNRSKEKKQTNPPIKKEQMTKPLKKQNQENRESLKKNIINIRYSSNISQKAKLFTQNSREIPKKIDQNNPINKRKSGGVKAMAKIFEPK